MQYDFEHEYLSRTILGMKFKNPVGLAAGLDKDGKWINELACLGFGFIEVGTVTPQPQAGNEKPRLFRLKKDRALINRMGFNNEGVEKVAASLQKQKPGIIVGGNIGKNKTTPNENALDDYIKCLDGLYGWVDYFVVNVSSPNTPGLRELQEKEPLQNLLHGLKNHIRSKPKNYPLLLKVGPDLTEGQVEDIVQIVKQEKVDGIIVSNTTIARKNLKSSTKTITQAGEGGLSGQPLRPQSTEILRMFRQKLGTQYPIIGVGGIMSPEDAKERLKAGADLVQVYTGLIYEGPALVRRINNFLINGSVKFHMFAGFFLMTLAALATPLVDFIHYIADKISGKLN